MIHLPIPHSDPIYILIKDPVFFDIASHWDVLKSGEILATSPDSLGVKKGLSLEMQDMLDEWHSLAFQDINPVYSQELKGWILEEHEELGFSFIKFWLVPPDKDFVIRHLTKICLATPALWQGWLNDELGLPELSVEYLDRMLPVTHHDPALWNDVGFNHRFWEEVVDAIDLQAKAWRDAALEHGSGA
jgi:hypothetical protein